MHGRHVHGNCVSVCTDVSNEIMGVQGRMCLYISTKGTGIHVITFTDESTVKTVLCAITSAYDYYRRYNTHTRHRYRRSKEGTEEDQL